MNSKTRLQDKLELIVKAGSALIVILYVLGLLVTNANLMKLGIADFSALQARFVLTGFLFLFYVFLLIGFPISFVIAILVAHKFIYKKIQVTWFRILMFLFVLSMETWAIVVVYGSVLAYLYPWGPSYESQWSVAFSLSKSLSFITLSLQMIQEAFFHAKTLAGGGVACLLVLFALIVFKFRSELERSATTILLSSFCGLVTIILLLFGYAQSVFPNLPYNLGGGQPKIVQVYVRNADASLLSTNDLTMKPHQAGFVESTPLALWHQDSSFLYVTPTCAQEHSAVRMIAIRADAITMLSYLDGYVKVSDNMRIKNIHIAFSNQAIKEDKAIKDSK